MPVLPDLFPQPMGATIDATEDAGRFAPEHAPQTGMDGSPALRPGDPDPAPASDGAPIFSTDPLAG